MLGSKTTPIGTPIPVQLRLSETALTYYNLLNGHYNLSIPSKVGNKANSLFLGLLYKANRLGLPVNRGMIEFDLANSEAWALSGATSLSMFKRDRHRLQDFLVDRRKLLQYKESTKGTCGTYRINYRLLLDYYRIPSSSTKNEVQKSEDFAPFLREEKKRKNPLFPSYTGIIPEEQEACPLKEKEGVEGVVFSKQKNKKKIQKDVDLLIGFSIKPEVRQYLAKNYDTAYLHRHIKQIKKDYDAGQRWGDSAAILVSRITKNSPTPDFPAEEVVF